MNRIADKADTATIHTKIMDVSREWHRAKAFYAKRRMLVLIGGLVCLVTVLQFTIFLLRQEGSDEPSNQFVSPVSLRKTSELWSQRSQSPSPSAPSELPNPPQQDAAPDIPTAIGTEMLEPYSWTARNNSFYALSRTEFLGLGAPLPSVPAALLLDRPVSDIRNPQPEEEFNADIGRIAAKRTPPAWKDDVNTHSTQSSYYNLRQGATYQCRSLGQLDFRPFPAVNHTTGHIQFGGFRVKSPRFIHPGHVVWWQNFVVFRDRQSKKCVGTLLHGGIPATVVSDVRTAMQLTDNIGKERPIHDGWLEFCEEAYTEGHISKFEDVEVSAMGPSVHACAPEGRFEHLTTNGRHRKSSTKIVKQFNRMVWNVIPAVLFVQHYVQNSLPKFAAMSYMFPELLPLELGGSANGNSEFDIIGNQEMENHRVPIIPQFYRHMAWLPPVDVRNETVHVKELIYPCRTPPLHPLLWQLASRAVLRMPAPKPLEERRKIVYCGRSRTGSIDNQARRVLNELGVLRVLEAWGTSNQTAVDGWELVEFDHRKYPTIPQLIEFWSDARALIGPHGGCLTNLVFLPCNSLLVELMPLLMGRRPPTPHPAMMMYMQAMFLEHEYWMLPSVTMKRNGDFDVDLYGLCRILEESLGSPSTKYGNGKSCESIAQDATSLAKTTTVTDSARNPTTPNAPPRVVAGSGLTNEEAAAIEQLLRQLRGAK